MTYEFAAAFDNGGETHDRYRIVIADFSIDDYDQDACVAFNVGERVSDVTDYNSLDAYPGETEIAFETLPDYAKRRLANELKLYNSAE